MRARVEKRSVLGWNKSYIYPSNLVIFPSYADSTSSDAVSTSYNAAITTLDASSTPQISHLSFVLQSLSRFLYINIFDILRMVSRVLADIFATMHDFHDMDLSSGILRGTSIYYLLGMYCILQSYHIGNMERVHPTHSLVVAMVS